MVSLLQAKAAPHNFRLDNPLVILSDSTQRLKAWASVSSQLRFSQRVHRLIIAPPAGDSPKS